MAAATAQRAELNTDDATDRAMGDDGARDDAPAAREADKSISIVIVSYWTGPLLSRCIASALAQPHVKEVILVDNGNWAMEIERAVALSPQGATPIKVYSGHGNIGFAAGCNLGARHAVGEYLLILNPDATLAPGALEAFIAEGGAKTGPWLIGGKLVDPDGGEQAGARRATLTPWTALVEMLRLYKIAPRHPHFRKFNHHGEPCPTQTIPVPTISGACMFLRRSDYDAIGGMDEGYFLHVEDIDFCLRFTNNGGSIYFAPAAQIVHHKSSSRANPIRVEYHKSRSLVRYFWTHFRDTYTAIPLAAFTAGIWGVFVLRAIRRGARRFCRTAGLVVRAGGEGWRRLRRMSARRGAR